MRNRTQKEIINCRVSGTSSEVIYSCAWPSAQHYSFLCVSESVKLSLQPAGTLTTLSEISLNYVLPTWWNIVDKSRIESLSPKLLSQILNSGQVTSLFFFHLYNEDTNSSWNCSEHHRRDTASMISYSSCSHPTK